MAAAVLGGTAEPPFGVVAVGPDFRCFVQYLYGYGVPPNGELQHNDVGHPKKHQP